MTGTTLDLEDYLEPDRLATRIAEQYTSWEMLRNQKVADWQEVQRYVFATDTSKTSNSILPWSNKTTIPKLCQVRDNLFANYMASMFPKRNWLMWEGDTESDEDAKKKESITSYISWAKERNEFYDEAAKLVLDYIDYGNAIGTVAWVDRRSSIETARANDKVGPEEEKAGFVGPTIKRISPLDIVFNPTAPDFTSAPKIIKSIISIGEVKEILDRLPTDEMSKEEAMKLYEYMKTIRQHVSDYPGSVQQKDVIYNIAGFESYRSYLQSNYCEVLTFYGDIYDEAKNKFERNQIIRVVDRHKILSQRANPSFFGTAPIFHAGWRVRPDNLWAMGPLDNLVGMQYRIDHLENVKADVWDLIAFPPLGIKGYVEDFEWGPFERIYMGDDGNVEVLSPNVQALSANTEIAILEQKMEEMAGSPKEAMGFRTPGEKTKYEVQRLENAASRIFQNKIAQFERQMIENLLNAMLELARRNIDKTTIRIFDTEQKVNTFKSLTPEDITGHGRLKPVAARHFAEKAQQVQDLTNFLNSTAGSDPSVLVHFSSVGLARFWEHLLDIEDYNIVEPYIRITEQADAKRFSNIQEEQVSMDTMTSSGLAPEDYDLDQELPSAPTEQTARAGNSSANTMGLPLEGSTI